MFEIYLCQEDYNVQVPFSLKRSKLYKLLFGLFCSRNLDTVQEVSSAETFTGEAVKKPKTPAKEGEKINRPKFLHIHVKAIFQGLITGASLLPSLKAQHKVISPN